MFIDNRDAELITVVDEHNEPTGEIKPRKLIHDDRDWHRMASVYIINRQGQILCHERASEIQRYPGKWQPYVGGHVRHEETPLGTAVRELYEEVILRVSPSELKKGPLRASEEKRNWIYTFLYKFSGDIEELRFLDRAVAQVAFLRFDHIVSSMQKKPERWASRLSSLEEMRPYLT